MLGVLLYIALFKQLKVEVSKFTELKSLVVTSKSIKETQVAWIVLCYPMNLLAYLPVV